MMTKHLPRQSLDKCMRHLNQFHVTGRAKAGLDVQGTKGSEKTPGAAPSGPPKGDLSGPTESLRAAHANSEEPLLHRVRFSDPVVIQVPNWKRDNSGNLPCTPATGAGK